MHVFSCSWGHYIIVDWDHDATFALRTVLYYRRAGETALRVYANADAITAFQRAAALFEAVAHGRAQREQLWQEAAALYTSLGDIFATTGRQQEARQIYQDGMACVPPQEFIWQARLLRKQASTWNFASDNPLDTFHINAQQTFQEAERVLEQATDQVKCRVGARVD